MTLFADSSALVKAYIDEADSQLAAAAIATADDLAASRIAHVEVVARLLRDDAGVDHLKRFESLIERAYIVEIDATLCRSAATLSLPNRVSAPFPP